MNSLHANGVVYEEEQRFRQTWLWVLLIPVPLLLVSIFGYGLYQQIYLGKPFGTRPVSNEVLMALSAGAMILAVGLPWFFWNLKLRVRVYPGEVRITFLPFTRRAIARSRIVHAEAATYKPLLEYGGWGMRLSLLGRGLAYNVSGNRGVRLTLDDSSQLLIGSQHPEDLARAILEA